MRFYASHACFVDLQRCLCTHQRHTSRLLSLFILSLVHLSLSLSFATIPGRSSCPACNTRSSLFWQPPSLPSSRYIFDHCHLASRERNSTTLRQGVGEKESAVVIISAGANHRFLNTRPNTVGSTRECLCVPKILSHGAARAEALEQRYGIRSIFNDASSGSLSDYYLKQVRAMLLRGFRYTDCAFL